MRRARDQIIVERIREAVAEHRLRAGTKLREPLLSELFGCNRAFVRRALVTLAAEKIVEFKPNRGAYVATPSPKEANDVFQARRAIERTIIRNVVSTASSKDLKRLSAHCDQEGVIRASENRREAIRMSGTFHLILGEIGQNEVLKGFLEELVLRSSLIVGLYAPLGVATCGEHEHRQIVDAIARRDEAASVDLLDGHLRRIEAGVCFAMNDHSDDLRTILGIHD